MILNRQPILLCVSIISTRIHSFRIIGFLLLNKVREEALGIRTVTISFTRWAMQTPFELWGGQRACRRVSRNAYAIFFLCDFQSSYPIVQDILYKEEEGITYFPTGVRLVSALFISL